MTVNLGRGRSFSFALINQNHQCDDVYNKTEQSKKLHPMLKSNPVRSCDTAIRHITSTDRVLSRFRKPSAALGWLAGGKGDSRMSYRR